MSSLAQTWCGCPHPNQAKPEPLDFGVDASNHLDLRIWHELFDDCDDGQLVSHMKHGVTTQTQLDNTTLLAASLVSLRHGLQSISDELKRLEDDGYVKSYDRQPTWPIFTAPIGAVPKKGSSVWRKIVDRGFPWVALVATDLMRVLSPNQRVRWHLPLPPELKPYYSDVAIDICNLRYIGDLLGRTIVQFADDLKDWFHQAATHVSEHWLSSFVFLHPGDDHLTYYQETCMGMGYVHSSNIAQRLSNTVLVMWYRELESLDSQFLRAERKTNQLLDEYLRRRGGLDESNGFTAEHSLKNGKISQSRLHSCHIFTDDFHATVLEPPHHSRLTVAIAAWHKVLSSLNIRPARPDKRMVGASIPWTGIISIACLALQVLQQEKVMRAFAWLLEAASGQMTVEDYNKLAGLVGFARHALALPKQTAAIMWEPLRKGFEKARGPLTKVESTARRRKHWQIWTSRLLTALGAPCTRSLPRANDEPSGQTRAFVWFQDAAVEGTNFPALGAYSHGLYWVVPITKGMVRLLSIAPLELLAIVGSILTFGPTLPSPAWNQKYVVLLQSDSLTSTWKLQEGRGKALAMEFIYDLLVHSDEFNRLKSVLSLGHTFGEGNPLADNFNKQRGHETVHEDL